mmetsp:Transcript_198/g.457  ORF Transcript_198/g.457 Transcript_198/m.457 type:complete len:242 (+) Transcript_198:217-942(+)|eukprot:CAMPEP_0197592588 /NCGR_PEP_ID=MMETSP1326-20131121/15176_1 /TAXON_ID=1155430 /ORGANISM="Genus nov. species nov., Strain RCC2288" /LENGTH=241 /DNA_ID=CAMNT_0043158305 /DNA_START=196 /DNA_END=921 /DNA_ORIENTATION=-
MKFLEDIALSRLNAFLGSVNVGDYVVLGQLEAYSCKLAGIDKKLSKSLDQEVVTMMATSPSALSVSPVGPLTDSNSRKTLIYLILTLNHMYPDYDFSGLRGHHFTKEPGVLKVKDDIDSLLLESAKVYADTIGAGAMPLSAELWKSIDEAIGIVDSDVYSYKAVVEGDPFCDDSNLWSFNYFFYNRKLKRILYFSCRAVSKTANDDSNSDDDGDGDWDDRAGNNGGGVDDSFTVDDMEMDY